MRVEAAFSRMQDAPRHPYLENDRAIPARRSCRASVFLDGCGLTRGSATFPHFDREGLCGFERKNKGFTGFASGGTKGLWLSREQPDDSCLVFCEAAISRLDQFPDRKNLPLKIVCSYRTRLFSLCEDL
jgi:hypothetical protein